MKAVEPGLATPMAGVRFLDSGRTFFFDPKNLTLGVGEWVAVETDSGTEAGRVVIAPHQVRLSMLNRDLKPILRRLSADDVERMERLKQVEPRDEARLVGSLGRSGRTLYRSSLVPVDAENVTKLAMTEDLPLVSGNLTGAPGRRVHGSINENERYAQLKSVMPRLGQVVETAEGPGMVVAMHILKELVIVRLDADQTDYLFSAVDLGYGQPEPRQPVEEVSPPALN